MMFPKPARTPRKAPEPLPRNTKPIARSAIAKGSTKKATKKPKPAQPFTPQVKRISKAERERLEFARTHHSVERVEWVKTLPCCSCGVVGYSVNAHVGNEGAGTGQKANYDQIAPLCHTRLMIGAIEIEGCHEASHRGQRSFEIERCVDLAAAADETQRAWLERCAA